MATTTKNRIEANGVAKVSAAEAMSSDKQVIIAPVMPKTLVLRIEGITPLLVCAWSKKAKQMMLDKQMKKAKTGREAKNPEQDYHDSRYISTEGWDGVPAGGVKGCLVNACRAVDGLPMTLAKRMVFVKAQGRTEDGQELVKIIGDHRMHQGMVRIDQGGTADIRFRAIYEKWEMELEIDFLSTVISAEQVANLVELAGFVEGLCEWRPGAPKNNTGSHGRFRVKRGK